LKFKVLLFLSTVLISILFNLGEVLAQDSFKHEKISFLGGYSFNSVEFLGKTSHSQTQIFTLGYHKEIKEYSNGNLLWYTTYFIPYIHYTYPKRDDGNRVVSKRGFGVSPIGFLLNKENSKRLSPFIETSGGFIYMESEFPTDDSRKLNYTFDIALGADVKFDSFGTLSFGYKFHHISNAETGSENPGLDSNFIFIKFSI
jgi:hypothetical protein